MRLSRRALNALTRHYQIDESCVTVEFLSHKPINELRQVPELGKKSLDEICEALAEAGAIIPGGPTMKDIEDQRKEDISEAILLLIESGYAVYKVTA